MDNITKMEIRAEEVLSLLQERLAIMPGSRDRRGGLLLLFPTTPKRERTKPEDYRRLLQYLTSTTNDEDRSLRFTIVVDMRGATWDSVKLIFKVHTFFFFNKTAQKKKSVFFCFKQVIFLGVA